MTRVPWMTHEADANALVGIRSTQDVTCQSRSWRFNQLLQFHQPGSDCIYIICFFSVDANKISDKCIIPRRCYKYPNTLRTVPFLPAYSKDYVTSERGGMTFSRSYVSRSIFHTFVWKFMLWPPVWNFRYGRPGRRRSRCRCEKGFRMNMCGVCVDYNECYRSKSNNNAKYMTVAIELANYASVNDNGNELSPTRHLSRRGKWSNDGSKSLSNFPGIITLFFRAIVDYWQVF